MSDPWSLSRTAWLNILAVAESKGVTGGIKGVLMDHYKKYGRSFFSRWVHSSVVLVLQLMVYASYDYEEVDSEGANNLMKQLEAKFGDSSFVGSQLKATTSDTTFTVKECDNFSYTDPIDKSVSKNQGLYVRFTDGSRIVFRLSGTGSSGATVRMYAEKYSKDESEFGGDTQEGLKPLIEVALSLTKLQENLKVDKPTVITVSHLLLRCRCGSLRLPSQ